MMTVFILPVLLFFTASLVYAGNECHGELLHQRKKSQPFWATIAVSPVFNEQAKLIHLVAAKAEEKSLEVFSGLTWDFLCLKIQ